MRRRAFPCLVVACAALVAGCGGGASEVPEIIGEINNEYLTTDEYLHQCKVRGGGALQGPARTEFKRWLLAELVDRKLLLQEARRYGIRPARAAVRARIFEMGSGGWEDAERAQLETVEDELCEQRQIEDLMRRALPPARDPTDGEVRRYVQTHPEEFRRPAQIRLHQIVVHSAAMVENAERMIKAGESFEGVARRLGGSPPATVLGPAWDSAEDLPDEVWEAVRKASPGERGGPVTSEYGFHFFRVAGSRDAGMMAPAEAVKRARGRLLAERRHGAVEAFLARLRGAAVIRVDLKAVAAL